jgi:hypothetical protein
MSAGRFVWRELVAASPATAFYADLFGWTSSTSDMGGMAYTLFRHPGLGEDVGGSIAPQMAEVPPHWLDYVTVTDLDAAAATITRLGGKVLTPMLEAGGVGRFFVAQDPAGAVFAPFLSATPGATPDRTPPAGTFCWSTLMTNHLDRVVPFYAEVFGWTAAPMGPMVVFSDGKTSRASAQAYPPGAPMPDAWLKYVAVDDTDAMFTKAVGLGAKAIVPPSDVPGLGRFAVLADPSGAVFALWKHTGPAM